MHFKSILVATCVVWSISGCAIVAVADAVVTTGATVVKVGVKTVGAAVDAVLPDKKTESDKDKR